MKKRVLIIAGCFVVLSVAIIVWQYAIPAFRTRTFYIAVAGPFSGNDAVRGQEMLNGITLALKHFHSDEWLQDREIRLLKFDDRGDEATAAKIARDITNDARILLVLGHLQSATALVAGNIYKRQQIPAITASATATSLTQGNEWYFRTTPNNTVQAKFTAQYIKFALQAETVSLIYTSDTYGSSLVPPFVDTARRINLNIIKKLRVNVKRANVEKQLRSLTQSLRTLDDPGVIFLAMAAPEAARLITMLRDAGTTYTFIGSETLSNAETFLNAFPDDQAGTRHYSDGVYAIAPFISDIANPQAQTFRNAYLYEYHKEPSWIAASYYDAAAVAIEAIVRSEQELLGEKYVRTNRKKIRQTLTEFYDMKYSIRGITGNIYFDLNGDVNLPYSVGRYEQQQFLPAFTQYQMTEHVARDELLFQRLMNGENITVNDRLMDQFQVVYTGILVHNITHNNLRKSRYTVDFSLWFRFFPFRYSAQPPPNGVRPHANITFENAVTPIRLEVPIQPEHSSNDETLEIHRLQAEFEHHFDFQAYPFDTHRMPIRFHNTIHLREQLIYVQDPAGVPPALKKLQPLQHGQSHKIFDNWKITNISMYQDVLHINSTLGNPQFFTTRPGLKYSRFITDIHIKRKDLNFVLTLFIPIIFVIGIICATHFTPSNWLGLRTTFFMAALLITALGHIKFVSDLPVDYLTLFEYALLGVYAVIAIAMYISISAYVFYEKRLALLQHIPLFKPFSDKMKSTLSKKMRRWRIKRPGQKIISQGEDGDSLFVIIEGDVEAWRRFEDGTYITVNRITTGGFFGEMALLTGEKRTADVIAATPVFMGEITKAHIAPFFKKHPNLISAMCEEIIQRKIIATQLVGEYHSQQLYKDSLIIQYRHEIQQFFGILQSGVSEADEQRKTYNDSLSS